MAETRASRRWRKIVAAHNASGMTIKAFATSHRLKPGTLSWWRSELKRRDAETEFTELVVAEPQTGITLTLNAFKAHVVVQHDTDLELLRRILEATA